MTAPRSGGRCRCSPGWGTGGWGVREGRAGTPWLCITGHERTEPHGAKLPGVPLGSRVGAEHSPRVKKCPSPELEKEPPKD